MRDGTEKHMQEVHTCKGIRVALEGILVYHTHDENRDMVWRKEKVSV